MHAFAVNVGDKLYVLYIIFRNVFEPDALPYARAAGVKAAVGLRCGDLLSGGLKRVGGIVERRNIDPVFAVMQKLGDIEAYGGVAARVFAREGAVDVHAAAIVRRAYVKKHASVRRVEMRRQSEGADVPHALHIVRMAYARKTAFRHKRHGYGVVVAFLFKKAAGDARVVAVYIK